MGSLVAAVGSWLDARAQGGEWRVRIEDVDRAREVPGAADEILATLERFGLAWDGPVLRQSDRGSLYQAAFARLEAAGLVYPCSCSRAELEPGSGGETRYPGTCRAGPRRSGAALSYRLRTDGVPPVTVEDRIQGALTQDVGAVVGDFGLRRRDGFWSYQLAVVIDDADQGITDVVRGLDLWDNTPRQRLLQACLKVPALRYLHLPLVVQPDGAKLSKSRAALPADSAAAPLVLSGVLGLLRHPVGRELHGAPVEEQLSWAARHLNIDLLQGLTRVLPPA